MVIPELLFGAAWGYAAASVSESLLHRHVLHAGARFRRLWRRHPYLFSAFRRAYYSHHVIHHARTYRRSFVEMFRDEQERQSLDRQIPKQYRRLIIAEKYGTTQTAMGAVYFLLPSLPVIPLTYTVWGGWATIGTLVPLLLVYPLMSMCVHPFVHRTYGEALAAAPRLVALFLKTRYVRAVIRHHYLHHRYVNCNFNLLLGGDLLLGVHRRPSAEDLAEIAELGLPTD
jgi:hypothetical protein